ncbi:hypothetical protein NEPAR06_1113 [Nematocida parisii]|nr:hypothetical protein NEPAR06_1113 [Nematocida parisii]
MPDPLCKDIQKVDHSNETLKKIRRYRMTEDFSQLVGMDIPLEIEKIRQGLTHGSTDSFLELAEYMWMELVRDNSLLRTPFRTFIEKNKLIRLIPPTPLIPIIFLFSGEEVLKEWCIINICELYTTPNYLTGMVTGGTFFYKIHEEILQDMSKYKERNFLKSLFIFVVLGGALVHPHYALLEAKINNNLSDDISIKFNIYKVLTAGEVTITGEVKRKNKLCLHLISRVLQELTRMPLDQFLAKNRQETSEIRLILLFTTWEMLELSIKLDIPKELKLLILRSGHGSRNRTIRKRIYTSVVRMHAGSGISLLELFKNGLLEYILARTEYEIGRVYTDQYKSMIRSLVIDTVDLINTYKLKTLNISTEETKSLKRPEYKNLTMAEIEDILLCSCSLWRDRLSIYSDCAISAFISLFFFRVTTKPFKNYSSKTAAVVSVLQDLSAVVSTRLDKLDKSMLKEKDRVIMDSLLNKKYSDQTEPAKIEILLELIKECSHFYACTGIMPGGITGLCGVIEKYINNYIVTRVDRESPINTFDSDRGDALSHENISEECDLLRMLYELVQMPITDSVLSQINYIVLHLDKIASDTIEIDFTWICKLDLRMASKTNLKMTFLKNLFDKYLILAHDSKTMIKSVVNDFQRIKKENNLKDDEAMKRLIKRAEKILEKKKEQVVEHTTKDIPAIPQTQDIITWQKPLQEVREKTQTNKEFILALLRNEPPIEYQSVKSTYSTFLDYFSTYSPLIIKEALASIESSITVESVSKKPIDGIVMGKHDDTRTTTLAILTRHKQSLLINDIVRVVNLNNTDENNYSTGIVMYEKEGQYEIMVCMKSLEKQGRCHKVSIQLLANITSTMREYDALIRLQKLAIRSSILDPCKFYKKDGSVTGMPKGVHAYNEKSHPDSILNMPGFKTSEINECPLISAFYSQLNKSQQAAVYNALLPKNSISLIQGPPGTGKTKTISGMIACFLLQKRRVLVCAPSNAAVDMLIESGSIWKRIPDCRWIRIGSAGGSRTAVERDGMPLPKEEKEDILSSPSLVQDISVQNTPTQHAIDPKDISIFGSIGAYDRRCENLGDYTRQDSKSELSRANLVFCTLSMAGSSSLREYFFDILIIDEACQATEPSTLIPLRALPSKLILVGDPMQLPPTIISQEKELTLTLFERLSSSIPPLLLDTQYRMNSMISKFASQQFYNDKLKNGVIVNSLLPFAFIDAEGVEKTDDKDIYNKKEITTILQFYGAAVKAYGTVGIISPYKGQVSRLKKYIRDIDIATVDGFQGQEKDCIIISTVRSKRIGFLSDIRRMNVALTRARYTLIIVGSMRLLQQDPTWQPLIKYVNENNFVYKVGEVLSILTSIKDQRDASSHSK